MRPNGAAALELEYPMSFVRTVLIIAALMLGWFAVRAESSAHSMPPPAVELQPAS